MYWVIASLILFVVTLRLYLVVSDQRIIFHSQNLSDKKPRAPMWRHGRCWWYITPNDESKYRRGPGARAEWSFFSRDTFALDITVLSDENEDIQFHVGIPYLTSIWFTLSDLPFFDRIPHKWRRTYGYETSIKAYSGSLWLHFIHTDMWGSGSPRWKWLPSWIHVWYSIGYKEYRGVGFYISFDFDRLIFGKRERTETAIGETIVAEIPIEPDNSLGLHYFANFQKKQEVRWRSHFPWQKKIRAYWDISTENPPLHAGKGESDWDQGDDGILGTGSSAETVDEAIADYVSMCQRDRQKYGMPSVIDKAQ